MANLSVQCHVCGKSVTVKHETKSEALQKRFILYTCGHALEKKLEVSPLDEIMAITTRKGHKPFKYQAETVLFAEQAGLQYIINHEMGVGKMVCECLLIRRHLASQTNGKGKWKKVLIVCPASITRQWFAHCVDWIGEIPQILTTKSHIPVFDFHNVFIVSVDTLHRLPWMGMIKAKQNIKLEDSLMNSLGYQSYSEKKKLADKPEYEAIRNAFDHIVIDEVQRIKNPSAQRTQAVKKVAVGKDCGTLSGTPIKNNAGEYFSSLNIVRPDMFPTEAGFLKQHVWTDSYGKAHGLKNPERFHELTKDFIIRFTRDEVLPDLPKIFRQYMSAQIEDKASQDAYENELDAFLDYMDGQDGEMNQNNMTNILGYFARMRHIAGLSKIDRTVEYAEEFLLSTDRKLAIFVHHKDVMELIAMRLNNTLKLAGYNEAVMFTADSDRLDKTNEFALPGNRIAILSTLASGEGLNLQFCSDCLFVERQWNPANEEQAESRFPRPGNTSDKINAGYLIASGTIDEMFTELVEKKRSIMGQVLDNIESNWSESTLMAELTRELTSKGKNKWRASLG